MRAKDIVAVAESKGIKITGVPERARTRTVVVKDSEKVRDLVDELTQIKIRGEDLKVRVWETAEAELKVLRAFIDVLVSGITERIEQLTPD